MDSVSLGSFFYQAVIIIIIIISFNQLFDAINPGYIL